MYLIIPFPNVLRPFSKKSFRTETAPSIFAPGVKVRSRSKDQKQEAFGVLAKGKVIGSPFLKGEEGEDGGFI